MKQFFFLANFLLLALLCGCTGDPGSSIREILQKDQKLTRQIKKNWRVISSPQELVSFYKKNLDERSHLIAAIEAVQVPKKLVLDKSIALDFLKLENVYCEAVLNYEVLEYDVQQSDARIEKSGLYPVSSVRIEHDSGAGKAALDRSDIHRALANKEAELQKYGWSSVWSIHKAGKTSKY